LIHRSREAGDYVLPIEDSITVTLYEDGGNTREADLPITEYGTAKGEFILSSRASPGYYRLETEYGMVLFQVAEYRKPEINVALSFENEESILGADWNGNVNARYYFNAPADDIDLSWTLRAERSYFSLPGYQVGRLISNWFAYPSFSPFTWGTVVATGEGITDGDGTWSTQGEIINLDSYDREISYLLTTYLVLPSRMKPDFKSQTKQRCWFTRQNSISEWIPRHGL